MASFYDLLWSFMVDVSFVETPQITDPRYTTSGRPVRRKGSAQAAAATTKMTKTTTKATATAEKATSKETATPLPAGWAMSWDDTSKSYYYWPVTGTNDELI